MVCGRFTATIFVFVFCWFHENVAFSQRIVYWRLNLVDNSIMEPLRIDNTVRKPRIHILHKHQARRWNSVLSLTAPDNKPIRLSQAHRHFERLNHRPGSPSTGSSPVGTKGAALSSLRNLTGFLHRLERENGSAENAMSAMERLGRETVGLLSALRDHFTNAPATVGIFDYEFGNRTNLADVDQWVHLHLEPLAKKRKRILTTDFDPRLSTLPANPIFGLIIEHLRKRIYDSSPHSSLILSVHLIDNTVFTEITERGDSLPPTPITDESTRLLWARVVSMLNGTIMWSGSPDCSETATMEHNTLRITYPLTQSSTSDKLLSSPAPLPGHENHSNAA